MAGSMPKCADKNPETREKVCESKIYANQKVQNRNKFVNVRFVNVIRSCERIPGVGGRGVISKGRI
jgi:hypothetical protein